MKHPSSLTPADQTFPLTSESVVAMQVPESRNHHHRSSMDWVKIRVLGKGSFGVVYLAVPTIRNLPCFAVKSARLVYSSSLLKERTILEKLSGLPEIVQCLGANVDSEPGFGFVYNLHLEYAAGGTLLDLIMRRGGKLTEREVQHYAHLILKGLCSIHEKGYVHCDLKPANILVFPGKDGMNHVKIADFGLTKEPNETLNPNRCKFRFRGTPMYMSPESVAFGEIETALDVWSLGCIVVEMFTGRPAIREMNVKTFMYEFAELKKTPIIPENMSDKGKVFLMKCFATNPKERWTTKMLLEHPFIIDEIMPESQVIQERSSLLLPSRCYRDLGFAC